jgi:hypothetical protein
MSLNCGHQRVYCSSPRWYSSMENHEWYWQGKTPDSSTRALCQYSQSSSIKAEGTREGNNAFCLTNYLFNTMKGSLTCCKILWHGADGFTSLPKEGVLRIFIALKNPLFSTVFETVNRKSNGQHANQQTTEDNSVACYFSHITISTYTNLKYRLTSS